MKKLLVLILAFLLVFTGCAPESTPQEETPSEPEFVPEESAAVVPNITEKTLIAQNPYLSSEEAMIHNDVYNTDVTNKPMPLGIYSEVYEGVSTETPMSPPAFFYDVNGNAICPYSLDINGKTVAGGIAIRDVDSENTKVLGSYLPAVDEGAAYGIQISYSFVDKENNLIGPTNTGHVVIIKTSDENGEILPKFEKILDADVISPAVKVLGEEIDKNLLSIVFDYEGNLWFATGGFHKNPEHSKAGFVGYLSREFIDRYIAGETDLDSKDFLFYQLLSEGENCENGIGSHPEGCVILTNKNCYLFAAEKGVNQKWAVPYESVGGKGAIPGEKITGTGLAWGGGSSPTITEELVLFTDNLDTVNLYAVDIKTGEVVVKTPVLDLGEDVIVSVENSICVYNNGSERTAVLVCNWYGAGNANLFNPGADSSIQTFANIYDANWLQNGSEYLMPGVERVDLVKQADGSYTAESHWLRSDLTDTCMIKYSTAAGCYYGYTQDGATGEWGFIALSAETGETLLWVPSGTTADYNNAAVGIMQGKNGNTIYCPTNSPKLIRMSDRFAYVPANPELKLDISLMERAVIFDEEFKELSDGEKSPVGYLLSATAPAGNEIAFRVNGLSGKAGELSLYGKTEDGKLLEREFTLTYEGGTEVPAETELNPKVIYEIRPAAAEGFNLSENPDEIKYSVILAK